APAPGRQPVRLFLSQAGGDRSGEPYQRDSRTLRLSRQRAGGARRERGAASCPPAQGGGRRVDRGLLPLVVHERGPRGKNPRLGPRRISRRAGLAVERGPAAHSRVATALDYPPQRL